MTTNVWIVREPLLEIRKDYHRIKKEKPLIRLGVSILKVIGLSIIKKGIDMTKFLLHRDNTG